MYIEGIHDARRFMSALRAAARIKPVILIKVGRHAAGAKAALSHTSALVGADNVFNAAVNRVGAVRVQTITQLFTVPPPRRSRSTSAVLETVLPSLPTAVDRV